MTARYGTANERPGVTVCVACLHTASVQTWEVSGFYKLFSYAVRGYVERWIGLSPQYHNGWLYSLDKNYFLKESDYLNGKLYQIKLVLRPELVLRSSLVLIQKVNSSNARANVSIDTQMIGWLHAYRYRLHNTPFTNHACASRGSKSRIRKRIRPHIA